ncbi:MAG: CRISPR-associated endonuclease Cas2 [Ignavibacteriaceae bacterium]
MYYILTYDLASPKRLPKALKICRKFLNWVQNSVFEGELTTHQMDRLMSELKRIINKDEDSVIVYAARTPEVISKEVLGIEKNEITIFL